MRRRLSTVLLLAGSAVLVWCASVWASAALFERLEYRSWSSAQAQGANQTADAPKPQLHDVVAWLDIPSVGISTEVLEGDDALSLRYGAGHIPSTPLPGEGGNVTIVARRDTVFRALRKIAADDRIVLRTPTGDCEYRVQSAGAVRKQASVPASPAPGLTLIARGPFQSAGAAPLRFIVRAVRVNSN